MRLPLTAIVSCILVALLVGSTAKAQSAQQIARQAFQSVVLLGMEDANGQPVSLGSGFFVREGVVATNLHVVEGASRGYAKLVGQKTKFDIAGSVGIDTQRDLVLLAVKGAKAPLLPLGDSTQVAVGDEVYAVGNPQGLEGTFSQGIISSVRQVGSDSLLQITAPISPGSSGGPVLSAQGKVIGVAVATFRGGQNLNFAIPASYLTNLLANSKLTTPLSGANRVGQTSSILDDLGERSSDAIIGGQFAWDDNGRYTGGYSFSLRNQLREPVKDVFCLVAFFGGDGQPIDVDVVRYAGIIPGGLAKRLTGKVDASVWNIAYTSKMQFRVLDFKIVE